MSTTTATPARPTAGPATTPSATTPATTTEAAAAWGAGRACTALTVSADNDSM